MEALPLNGAELQLCPRAAVMVVQPWKGLNGPSDLCEIVGTITHILCLYDQNERANMNRHNHKQQVSGWEN